MRRSWRGLWISLCLAGCGAADPPSSLPAIAGGRTVGEGGYGPEPLDQYLATVALSTSPLLDGENGRIFCTGTYYVREIHGSSGVAEIVHGVVTASHCLVRDDGTPYNTLDQLRVVFGLDTRASHAQRIAVLAMLPHPGFSPGGAGLNDDRNDVAVLRLASGPESLTLPGGRTVRVKPFDTSRIFQGTLQFGDRLDYFGFGVLSLGRPHTSGTLRSITNQVRRLRDFHHVQTFPVDYRLQSTCKGDSGGPSYRKNAVGDLEQIGVHLGGGGFCDEESFDTVLAPYASWIDEALTSMR